MDTTPLRAELIGQLGGSAGLASLLVLLGLLFAAGAVFIWLRRRRPLPTAPRPLDIDLAELGSGGPAAGVPALELYHVPVRVAALVLAPAGRGHDLPPTERLQDLLDAFMPGLARVLHAHHARIKFWPPQLSTQGFANALFAHLRLLGTPGKDSPWCAVAGRFEAEGRALLVGMLLCAATPNNLGHFTFERQAQWLDAVRVKL
ncbi:MAG: hypothetical protein WD278_16255 [Pirellulales bacterium]